MRGEVRRKRWEGVGRRRRKWHVLATRSGMSVRWPRGAHREHVAHIRDVGRVEAQRLVKRHRVLPSRKGGYDAGRGTARAGARLIAGS